jgi:hypothetical protein
MRHRRTTEHEHRVQRASPRGAVCGTSNNIGWRMLEGRDNSWTLHHSSQCQPRLLTSTQHIRTTTAKPFRKTRALTSALPRNCPMLGLLPVLNWDFCFVPGWAQLYTRDPSKFTNLLSVSLRPIKALPGKWPTTPAECVERWKFKLDRGFSGFRDTTLPARTRLPAGRG